MRRALLAVLALAACAPDPPPSVMILPPVVEYGPEFTARFADELEACACPAIRQYVIDQQRLRAAVRAARGDLVDRRGPEGR